MAAEQEDTKIVGVDPKEKHDNPLHDPDEEQGQVEGEGEVEAEVSGGEIIAEESHPESDDSDDSDIEMSHIYKASATDVIPTHQNPMHDPEDVVCLEKNITSVQAQNMELKRKNNDLEYDNKNVRGQNRILHQRVRELESQVKDYQKKDD